MTNSSVDFTGCVFVGSFTTNNTSLAWSFAIDNPPPPVMDRDEWEMEHCGLSWKSWFLDEVSRQYQ